MSATSFWSTRTSWSFIWTCTPTARWCCYLGATPMRSQIISTSWLRWVVWSGLGNLFNCLAYQKVATLGADAMRAGYQVAIFLPGTALQIVTMSPIHSFEHMSITSDWKTWYVLKQCCMSGERYSNVVTHNGQNALINCMASFVNNPDQVGCIPCMMYLASGGTLDWTLGVAGIPYRWRS